MGSKLAWTPERRARQAEIIRRTKPWTRSTGPRTVAGKARSSQNALKFKSDPKAREAYELIRQFYATGVVPPALEEIWSASDQDFDLDGFIGELVGAPLPDDFVDLWIIDGDDDYHDHDRDHDRCCDQKTSLAAPSSA